MGPAIALGLTALVAIAGIAFMAFINASDPLPHHERDED